MRQRRGKIFFKTIETPNVPEENLQKDRDGWFVKQIKKRLDNNRNFLCCVAGQTGVGKSALAIKIGERLDPDFDISRVLFDPSPFFGMIKTLPKRSFVVVDEAGIALDSHTWYSVNAEEEIPFIDEHNRCKVEQIEQIYGEYRNTLDAIKILTTDLKKPILNTPSAILKHKSFDKMLRITTKSGKTITGSLGHSFIIKDLEGIRIIKGKDLKRGMRVPVRC